MGVLAVLPIHDVQAPEQIVKPPPRRAHRADIALAVDIDAHIIGEFHPISRRLPPVAGRVGRRDRRHRHRPLKRRARPRNGFGLRGTDGDRLAAGIQQPLADLVGQLPHRLTEQTAQFQFLDALQRRQPGRYAERRRLLAQRRPPHLLQRPRHHHQARHHPQDDLDANKNPGPQMEPANGASGAGRQHGFGCSGERASRHLCVSGPAA